MNKTFDLAGVEEDVGIFKLCSCPELRIMKDSISGFVQCISNAMFDE
jgi:hypothetical protein